MKRVLALCCIFLLLFTTSCAVVDRLAPPSDAGGKSSASLQTDSPVSGKATLAPTVQPTPTPVPESTVPAWEGITVDFEQQLDESSREYAVISAKNASGDVLWTIETEHLEMAQMERIAPVGLWQDRDYFVQDDTLVALNVLDASSLWVNDDFSGSIASGAALIREDGSVCLAGYFGPDLFISDRDGNTLLKISEIHSEYYWAYRIEPDASDFILTFEGGPEGSWPDGYRFRVNPSDGTSVPLF